MNDGSVWYVSLLLAENLVSLPSNKRQEEHLNGLHRYVRYLWYTVGNIIAKEATLVHVLDVLLSIVFWLSSVLSEAETGCLQTSLLCLQANAP